MQMAPRRHYFDISQVLYVIAGVCFNYSKLINLNLNINWLNWKAINNLALVLGVVVFLPSKKKKKIIIFRSINKLTLKNLILFQMIMNKVCTIEIKCFCSVKMKINESHHCCPVWPITMMLYSRWRWMGQPAARLVPVIKAKSKQKPIWAYWPAFTCLVCKIYSVCSYSSVWPGWRAPPVSPPILPSFCFAVRSLYAR